jgi:hypothetical protein
MDGKDSLLEGWGVTIMGNKSPMGREKKKPKADKKTKPISASSISSVSANTPK